MSMHSYGNLGPAGIYAAIEEQGRYLDLIDLEKQVNEASKERPHDEAIKELQKEILNSIEDQTVNPEKVSEFTKRAISLEITK
ncbi:hypothetical protein GF354_06135 [Candidatus Peregrinibacteria bacterium]|nr:hypothetical protein [Candidatus Peregrinibacteria bacterium]